jgi:hypothetical protein
VVYVGNDGKITNELTVHELQSEQGRGDQSRTAEPARL